MTNPYQPSATTAEPKRLPSRAFKPIAWIVLLMNTLSLLVVVVGLVWMFEMGKVDRRTLTLAAALAVLIGGGMWFAFFKYPSVFVVLHVLATAAGTIMAVESGLDGVSSGMALLNAVVAALLAISYVWKRDPERRTP